MLSVPATRIRLVNEAPRRPDRPLVLYWMTSFRRLSSNFALQHAAETARQLGRPLVILEALRCDYPWASDRLHRFVIAGMAEHARALAGTRVTYFPFVEPSRGAGRGLIRSLAEHAAVVVTDDYPCFFVPRMVAAAASQIDARLEAVDSNGVLPMRVVSAPFVTALSYRAHLQRHLREHLPAWPAPIDWDDLPAPVGIPEAVTTRWPPTRLPTLEQPGPLLGRLPIDHSVAPVESFTGGATAARTALDRFVARALPRYAEAHSHPDLDGTSRLSPWLHFGHLSAHQAFDAVMTAERWTSRKLGSARGGKRDGWWGVSAGANAFLDQLITWRELGFNMCATRPADYWRYESLPPWARATLEAHAGDRREYVYTIDDFEHATTHDAVWNAAQRQLTRDGWMHNYLRMLWGKKILEWTRSPHDALDTMMALMNKHAIDGRGPNSYGGYLWTLGRYDRPWGPARPVFGTIRYMSSANTVRKLKMKDYLATYGPAAPV